MLKQLVSQPFIHRRKGQPRSNVEFEGYLFFTSKNRYIFSSAQHISQKKISRRPNEKLSGQCCQINYVDVNKGGNLLNS